MMFNVKRVKIRETLYKFLVNRNSGISYRYHKLHDGKASVWKVLSWVYLLWLNFCYYFLFCHFLGQVPSAQYHEEKWLPVGVSESSLNRKKTPPAHQFVAMLIHYDVISFDIFDTLLFRPFDQPSDIFYLLGEDLGLADFRHQRIQAEQRARNHRYKIAGDREVTLAEIWEELESEIGNAVQDGFIKEQEIELSLCYANPYMMEVWKHLKKAGKRLILATDMYLSEECIRKILDKVGFTGYEKIFISCEYRKSKADGRLYEIIRTYLGNAKTVHVGDNVNSDVKMAKRSGFNVQPYASVNRCNLLYRPYDMSYMVGSAYRGLVCVHLYNGLHTYSEAYEYGYVYGGLFVTGYCRFIHEYCHLHGIEQILFFSRDGDILRQAYSVLYPDERTIYARWSRKVATKLMAGEERHDFIRRFLDHKVGQGVTLREVLQAMDANFLLTDLEGILDPEGSLTTANAAYMRKFLCSNYQRLLDTYKTEQMSAAQYYREMLDGCKSAVAVDIGWAGSGALSLSYLIERVWNIPCRLTGIIAGTNTIYDAEPDASESFLQSGKLVSYLYSQRHNRDLLKKHNPNKEYNIYWELLLSSPNAPFVGFSLDSERHWELRFGKNEGNTEDITDIQHGILDFVKQYKTTFSNYPEMSFISGRDAYAPMLLASSHHARYLKAMRSRFKFNDSV